MTRLLGVLVLTLVAFLVATYSWNRVPTFTCTSEGLADGAEAFTHLAHRQPRKAQEELRKLTNRTRSEAPSAGLDALIEVWTRDGAPDPRVCRRLRESLARLS